MTQIERLETRTFLTVTGTTIVADQAAIQTAATACTTDLGELFSVVGNDDTSINTAAAGITAKRSLELLAQVHAHASEAVPLLRSEVDALTTGALSTTAKAANDASQLLSSFSTTLERVLITDEKALTAAVAKPVSKLKITLNSTTIDNELKALRAANGTNTALRTAIDQRTADSNALRKQLIAAATTLKVQVTAFTKSLKSLHGG